jgi:hypothetical protein
MLTVLDGKGAAQPAVVAPARVGADETRLEDVDGAWLHAQHGDLVEPAWPASVVELDAHAPRSSARRSAQCDPGIDQAMLVDEGVVVWVDDVEVTRNDAAAAPGLAQEARQDAHLQRPAELRVERVKVHVEQVQDGARRPWDGDAHTERVPLEPAGERGAEDAVEHQFGAALALLALALLGGEQRRAKPPAGEQRHRCERHACERRGVLSVGRQEARAHSGVVEERLPRAGRDFLEEHDVGELGSLGQRAGYRRQTRFETPRPRLSVYEPVRTRSLIAVRVLYVLLLLYQNHHSDR